MTTTPEATLLFSADAIRSLIRSLFEAYGAAREHAAMVADHLVESSLAGLHSHGVIRVPQYLGEVEAGQVDPRAQPVRASGNGPRVAVDGNRSFGQVAAHFAVDEAVACVAAHGAAIVTLRRCGHVGRIGVYPEALARQGYVALAFCSADPRTQRVALYGAREGRLSTNPIAYAFPTGSEPIVADFATSALAEGKIRSLRNRNLKAPPGVLRDADGAPSTDPGVLLTKPSGTLQPLGGPDFGYKGTALGIMVEGMATLLAGDDPVDRSRQGNVLTLIAVAPDPGFGARADALVAHLRSAAPIDPDRPILLPGDPERNARRTSKGVQIDAPTWQAITARAQAHRLAVPVPLEGLAVP